MRRTVRQRSPGPMVVIAILTISCTACESPHFDDDFELADLDREKWGLNMDPACLFSVTSEEVRQGGAALRISATEGSRCEVVPKLYSYLQLKFRREPVDEERWYRFSIYVEDLGEAGAPDGRDDNTIVAQWHSSPDWLPRKEAGRGPPLALRIFDGKWAITYGWDDKLISDRKYLANNWHWADLVETGRWVDWSFRVIWSHDEGGVTEVWKDGENVMRLTGPNTYNDIRGVYLKLGLYHPVADQVVLLDRVSISSE